MSKLSDARIRGYPRCKKCESRWDKREMVDGLCPGCLWEEGKQPDYDTRLADGFRIMRGYDDD